MLLLTILARGKEGQEGSLASREKRPRNTDAEIHALLKKSIPSLPGMKGNQLINLAKRLGCAEGISLKPITAKAFINRLQQSHGLL